MARRVHTEDPSMVEDVKRLKERGINWIWCQLIVTDKNGKDKRYKPVMKKTAQGISAYANKMFRIYGENITVEVYYFDEEMNIQPFTTYHA